MRIPIAIALILLAGTAGATIITVPGDQPTIQAALDIAGSGDVVEVATGTYVENLLIDTSGVTLRSATLDPLDVLVDGNGNQRALSVYLNSVHLTGIVVQGISFTTSVFQCIYVKNAEIDFIDCHSRDVTATNIGVAAFVTDATTVANFTGCSFYDNTAVDNHGTVYLASGVVGNFTDCVFFNNVSRSGSGAYVWDSTADFQNCTFSENTANFADGSAIREAGTSTVTGDRCILAFSPQGAAVNGTPGSVTLTCSNVFGNVDGDWTDAIVGQDVLDDNFSADPQFCGIAGSSNLDLQSDSPCAPAQQPTCGLVGALPVNCGVTAAAPVTWSAVKGLY